MVAISVALLFVGLISALIGSFIAKGEPAIRFQAGSPPAQVLYATPAQRFVGSRVVLCGVVLGGLGIIGIVAGNIMKP